MARKFEITFTRETSFRWTGDVTSLPEPFRADAVKAVQGKSEEEADEALYAALEGWFGTVEGDAALAAMFGECDTDDEDYSLSEVFSAE